jgi:hypothetical protein
MNCLFFFFFCRLCSHRKKDLLVEIRKRFPRWYKRALNCPFLVTNHAALPAVLLLNVQPRPSNPGLHVSIHLFVLLPLQCFFLKKKSIKLPFSCYQPRSPSCCSFIYRAVFFFLKKKDFKREGRCPPYSCYLCISNYAPMVDFSIKGSSLLETKP